MPSMPRGDDALNRYVSDLLESDEKENISGRIERPVLPKPQDKEKGNGRRTD